MIHGEGEKRIKKSPEVKGGIFYDWTYCFFNHHGNHFTWRFFYPPRISSIHQNS